MHRPQQFTAKLSEKIQLNEKFLHLYFELVEPNRMEFDAGQYVSIAIPGGDGARRSYSIASSPDKDHGFELMVDAAPWGLGTQYLYNLKFGDPMNFLGPLGMLTVAPEAVNDLVFIATGSGIVPFRSIVMDQLHNKKNTKQLTLYWGLRHEADLCWVDEFEQLAQAYPNFHFHPVISQALPEWPLCRGRVTDCLTVHELPLLADYYLCGNAKMIEGVTELLVKKQVKPENIHHEKFY